MDKSKIKRIAISRTDNIGDVVLTMPLAGVLKKEFPEAEVCFIGKSYTREILATSTYIDHYLNWDELGALSEKALAETLRDLNIDLFIHVFPNRRLAIAAKKAGIPYRLGTINRLFHWTTCNLRNRLSRRKSDLHEAQLNIKLLKGRIKKTDYTLKELASFYGTSKIPALTDQLKGYLQPGKKNIILHPRSLGSAREWGLENFSNLIQMIDKSKFNIIITGTQDEADSMRELLVCHQHEVTDTTGKLTLNELVALIANSTGLVAASTGPLHIAACTGVNALGLYVMTRPIHPGRWQPIGAKAHYLVYDEHDFSPESISLIKAETVWETILNWD